MERIDRFRIESIIGRGAMGVVYLASDPRLDRRVALKSYRLPDDLDAVQVEEFRQRFQREARAAAALTHPGIVTVYDAGEDPSTGVPFIAMEYVPGTSLRELLAGGEVLFPEKAIAIVVSLAEALHVAHEAGIVHRDVKPANILVRDSDGAVKITDFGVARIATSTLTSSGASIGSPAYMSPEQVRGTGVDGRSDLFSLAVIAYELLCGRRPFQGDEPAEVLYAVAHGTPIPPSRVRSDLPPGLDRFFETALAKEPAGRFADGLAFARALEQSRHAPAESEVDATLCADAGTFVAPRRSGVRRRLPRIVPAVLLLMTATLFGWLLLGRGGTYLKLDAKSGLTSGELTLLVDGEEVFRRDLAAPADQQGFLKRVARKNLESFEALIEVEAGQHEVAAYVAAPDGGDDYRSTIVVDLERGETRTLRLATGRMFGSSLSLKSK